MIIEELYLELFLIYTSIIDFSIRICIFCYNVFVLIAFNKAFFFFKETLIFISIGIL